MGFFFWSLFWPIFLLVARNQRLIDFLIISQNMLIFFSNYAKSCLNGVALTCKMGLKKICSCSILLRLTLFVNWLFKENLSFKEFFFKTWQINLQHECPGRKCECSDFLEQIFCFPLSMHTCAYTKICFLQFVIHCVFENSNSLPLSVCF